MSSTWDNALCKLLKKKYLKSQRITKSKKQKDKEEHYIKADQGGPNKP